MFRFTVLRSVREALALVVGGDADHFEIVLEHAALFRERQRAAVNEASRSRPSPSRAGPLNTAAVTASGSAGNGNGLSMRVLQLR